MPCVAGWSNGIISKRFPWIATPPPTALVILAIASTQLGAAIAKGLFPLVGPLGMVTMRVGFGALLLLIMWRPRWRQYNRADYGLALGFGVSLALMNSLYYAAIARIPIGVAVTLEFIGPLGVALLRSRRPIDRLWALLAALGILLLAPLPGSPLDPVGILLALLAGIGWGAYILLSAQMGQRTAGGAGLAVAMTFGALLLLPLGLVSAGPALMAQPQLLLAGLAVAVLSSVVTYSLELEALRHLTVTVFGVLMSLEPAIAALIGFLVLGEQLSLPSLAAIVLVSIAAAGVSRTKSTD